MGRWAPPELIAAAVGGDRAAVEPLLAAVWPACFRLAATLLGDRSLAQDAAQDACVIVHRKVRGLRSPDAFDAWLYRIVVRESSRVRRRRHAGETVSYADQFAADTTVALDVWRALATLSPELREVTVLFYFDDLTGEEIAAVLRVPHATVRTRLARARERLRGLLGDYAGDLRSDTLKAVSHAI
jgi:RNA polymerase sigma-70 factor, ECF subfamily